MKSLDIFRLLGVFFLGEAVEVAVKAKFLSRFFYGQGEKDLVLLDVSDAGAIIEYVYFPTGGS